MIDKNAPEISSSDPLLKKGQEAEKQMAFYLRRHFGDDPGIRVLNNIKLVHGGETAQIDHLVLHLYGAAIVESKSVTSKVTINKQGEWARYWNGKFKGMQSPLVQADLQGRILRSILEENAKVLMKKILGFQLTFKNMPIDIFVAISDSGIIERKVDNGFTNVLKAESVCSKIKETIQEYRSQEKNFLAKDPFVLGRQARANVSAFLRSEDQKARGPSFLASQETPVKEHRVVKNHQEACSKCGSQNIAISYGKYGYYFKCDDCQGNTAIKKKCGQCGNTLRVRKDKKDFFLECSACGTSALFFTNP